MNRNRVALIITGAALIAVCGLCVLTSYGTYAWFNSSQANVRFFDLANFSASVTENATYEAKPNLIINSDSGDITILPGEGPDFEVEMVKTGWGTNQAEAENTAQAIQVTVKETGDALELTYSAPDEFGIGISRGGPDSVDFTVHVPADTAVEISGGFGDISLSGLTERVTVESGFGDLEAKNLQSGDNPIRLVTSFGELQIENSQGLNFYLETSNGTITGSDLSATESIEVSNAFGDILLEGLTSSSVTLSTQNGQVEITDGEITEDITVTNAFGDIEVRNVNAGTYSLESQNGTIKADGVSGEINIVNRFGDIRVTNGIEAILDLQTGNGELSYSGSLDAESNHTLQNNFGNINLTIPKDSAFDLKLETSFGGIESEIPVTLTGTLEQTSWEAAINGGGKLINATTSNGNIKLQVLSGESE